MFYQVFYSNHNFKQLLLVLKKKKGVIQGLSVNTMEHLEKLGLEFQINNYQYVTDLLL